MKLNDRVRIFTKIICIGKRDIFLEKVDLHLNLPLKTVKNLCRNLQKPSLPSKIPGYAPVYRSFFSKVPDFRSATFLKRYLCMSAFLRNLKNFSEHLFIAHL